MRPKTSLLRAAGVPLLALCTGACAAEAQGANDPGGVTRARATLAPVGDSGVRGTITFERTADGIAVRGTIEGLGPGEHGFHVHQYGDLSDTAEGSSAGGHFAPRGSDHGRPSDEERHVGDLGNVTAGADGVAEVDIDDSVIALEGAHSIVGRAVVVHRDRDRFAQPSGEAGARVAFGVIGIAAPPEG